MTTLATTPISSDVTYCVRLRVESRVGHGWDAVTDQCTGIVAAADWRERMRLWCEANPLPAGLEYWIPLPRRIPAGV